MPGAGEAVRAALWRRDPGLTTAAAMAAVCAAMAVPFLAFWKPSVPQDVRENGLLSKLTTWMWVLPMERGEGKKQTLFSSFSPYWHSWLQDLYLLFKVSHCRDHPAVTFWSPYRPGQNLSGEGVLNLSIPQTPLRSSRPTSHCILSFLLKKKRHKPLLELERALSSNVSQEESLMKHNCLSWRI